MGLRRGEICSLSWGNIDFDRKVANIKHSRDCMGNLKATKAKHDKPYHISMNLFPMKKVRISR